ncbi:hypothetical protein DPMN_106048 [Dreissena polymorpha]|uniref:Uncharacterized protein n=1 Tax=Dreissena polymorpha TaxID=45954 RepID=A0A9D4QI18_DREPO|nr:hypothetical protein DPMN_106048 [Dreissena polymorpha]
MAFTSFKVSHGWLRVATNNLSSFDCHQQGSCDPTGAVVTFRPYTEVVCSMYEMRSVFGDTCVQRHVSLYGLPYFST